MKCVIVSTEALDNNSTVEATDEIVNIILKFKGDNKDSLCPGQKQQAAGIDDLTEDEYHKLKMFVWETMAQQYMENWYFEIV